MDTESQLNRERSDSATPAPRGTFRPTPSFVAAVRDAARPVVLGHVSPDADCLGAALGLATALRAAGGDAAVGLRRDATPRKLRFMLELAADVPLVETLTPDRASILVVDTASERRINFQPRAEWPPSCPVFNVDHHVTNTDFGTHNWIDPHASSTSEMIARLIEALGVPLPRNAASLLYAGIHGDTAGFSLPSTSAETLHTAGDLVRAGADVARIGEQLCRSQDRHDFELLRRVYDHATMADDGRIAYSFLTHDDIVSVRCSADDIDDQVSIPRALRGVRVAILFSEGEPGVIRVNLRGEGGTSVIEIAQAFGGGGHTQSAGIRVRGKPMREVIDAVVARAVEHLRAPAGC